MTAFTKALGANLAFNNLVPNGSFENIPPFTAATTGSSVWIDGTAAGTTTETYGWANIGGALASSASSQFDTTNSHSGNASLKLSTLNSTGAIVAGTYLTGAPTVSSAIPMLPNTKYTLTAWIKTNNVATNSAFLDLREYNAALGALTTTTSTKFSGTNGWTQITFTITTQATTAFFSIILRNNVTGNVGDAWFDDISVFPTNTPVLIKQTNRPFTPALSFVGAALKSTIHILPAAALSFTGTFTKRGNRALTGVLSFTGSVARAFGKPLPAGLNHNNLVPNGSFEVAPPNNVATTINTAAYLDGTANGTGTFAGTFGWNKGGSQGSVAALFDNSNTHNGKYSMKASLTAINSYIELFVPVLGGGFGGYNGKIIPVLPSTPYTLSFWMKTNFVSGDSNNGAALAVIESQSDGSDASNQTTSTSIKTTTGWTKYTLQFTTSATTAYIQINPRVYGHTGTATLIMDAWYDDIVLQPSTGILSRAVVHAFAGILSYSGSLAKLPQRALSGALSFTGAFFKQPIKALTAAFSITAYPWGSGTFGGGGSFGAGPTDALVKQTNRPLTATLSYTGSMVRRIAHPLTASLSYTGNLVRRLNRGFTAVSLSFAGSFAKTTTRVFAATLSFAGSIKRLVGYVLSATISPAGTLLKSLSRTLAAATLSFTGAFTKGALHVLAFTGVLSFAGAITKTAKRSLSATLSYTGSFGRTIYRSLAAGLNFTAAFVRSLARALQGSLSLTGIFLKTARRSLAATLSFSGTISRMVARSIAGGVSFTGQVARAIIKTGFTAAFSFTGVMMRRLSKTFTAALSFHSVFTKIFKRVFRRSNPVVLGQDPRFKSDTEDPRDIYL